MKRRQRPKPKTKEELEALDERMDALLLEVFMNSKTAIAYLYAKLIAPRLEVEPDDIHRTVYDLVINKITPTAELVQKLRMPEYQRLRRRV